MAVDLQVGDAPTAAAPLRVILDTDPGLGAPGADIDDGLAVMLALASPELHVEGLTVVNGNVELDAGTANVLALLERIGDDRTPVLRGARQPLRQDMAPIRALFDNVLPLAGVPTAVPRRRRAHGDDAAGWMVETVLAHPGEVTVVAIGPMTNLALALRREPAIATAVREFVLMAGSATTYAQNITTVGDFNAYVDPHALQEVLDSGARIRMVGIDQTSRVRLTRDHAATIRLRGTALSSWLAECIDQWIDFLHRALPARPEHASSCFLHDPLTIAAVTHPHLLTWQPAHVAVECESPLTSGLVVADRNLALRPADPPNALVAVDTDVDSFLTLCLHRLTSLL